MFEFVCRRVFPFCYRMGVLLFCFRIVLLILRQVLLLLLLFLFLLFLLLLSLVFLLLLEHKKQIRQGQHTDPATADTRASDGAMFVYSLFRFRLLPDSATCLPFKSGTMSAQGGNLMKGSTKRFRPIACFGDPDFSGGESGAGWHDVDDIYSVDIVDQGMLFPSPAPNDIAEDSTVASARHIRPDPTFLSCRNVEGEGGRSADVSPRLH